MPKLTYTNKKGLIQETGAGEVNLSGQGALFGQLLKIKKVTATSEGTLTEADSGKIILVNPAGNTLVTLPAVSNTGWCATIILTEDGAGADQGMSHIVAIDLGSGANLANIGQILDVDGGAGDYAVANDDFISCDANASAGDRFDIFSDGSRWHIHGIVKDVTQSAFATAAGF